MPNPATLRERHLRMTKAQLIDEIDTLEQRAAAIEATYVSTQTDVTDLKRAEEALRESQQLLDTDPRRRNPLSRWTRSPS